MEVWKGRQSNENKLCVKLVEFLKDKADCNLLVSRLKTLVIDEGDRGAVTQKHESDFILYLPYCPFICLLYFFHAVMLSF